MYRSKCSIGVSLPGLFALVLFTAYLATAACDDLPAIAGGVCGNRVLDAGEDCDDFPSDACHAPDTAHACRLNCRVAACPEGAACGVDGVCRTASGRMSAFPIGFDSPASLLSGDFDGDERTDLLLLGSETVLVSFDDQRRTSLVSLAVAPGFSAVSRINGDERDDVITYGRDELNVLVGTPTGLNPVPQLRVTPESASQRILSIAFQRGGRLEPLLIADGNLLAFPPYGEDLLNVGALAVSARDIAGPVPSLAPTNIDPCPAIVLAGDGAAAVHVYDICDSLASLGAYTLSLSRTVALPAPYLVGPTGVRVGDVDADGFDDLIIATRPVPGLDSEELLHVAYGLGRRSFQSRRRATAGVIADNIAASEPLPVPGERLLDVADLDGDAYLDFITDVGFTTSPLGPDGCNGEECIHYEFDSWVAAAAADFSRDGNVDLIAFPSGATSMRFFLGTGGGGFNPSTISVGAPNAEEGRLSVAVGDYDGDLTTDLAFTLQEGTGPASPRKAAILFGKAFGIPSEIQSTGLVGDFAELVTTSARFTRDSASDLLFRASTDEGVGVGSLIVGAVASGQRMAGTGASRVQPARVLSSPLLFPGLYSVEGRQAGVIALAFGAFTGDSSRQEAAALTLDLDDASGSDYRFWLPLVENRQSGLAIRDARESPIEAPAELFESLRALWMYTPLYSSMQALDLDADGSDELLIPDWHVTGSSLVFWVGRRTGGSWSFLEHRVELPPGSEAEILANQGGDDRHPNGLGPVDVDRDGRPDLVLQGWRPTGSVVYVVTNVGSETLSEAKAFVIDSSVNTAASSLYEFEFLPTAFINVDGDTALELLAASEGSLRFYDLGWAASTLDELTALRIESKEVARLTVADFDGDGISDVAASGEANVVYLGEPMPR